MQSTCSCASGVVRFFLLCVPTLCSSPEALPWTLEVEAGGGKAGLVSLQTVQMQDMGRVQISSQELPATPATI